MLRRMADERHAGTAAPARAFLARLWPPKTDRDRALATRYTFLLVSS